MYTTTQLDQILGRVAKPARYVGGEYNMVVKDPAEVAVHAAVLFPDVYETGMSSMGIQILYDRMNQRADTFCERVFTPWPDMETELRQAGIPLYTLETSSPISNLHLLGVSLGSEMTYTNVLTCLDLGHIPIWAKDRDETSPIVIAGGHCAFNPEPMSPFIDAFVIGEGEEVIEEILDSFSQCKGKTRNEKLLALAGIPGIYLPSFLEWDYAEDGCIADYRWTGPLDLPVRKRIVEDFQSLSYPQKPIVPNIETVHDRISIEVMRGCTQGCRFCQAGMITRPVRERLPEKVTEMVSNLLPATGHEDISLVSLSTADYTEVEKVVRQLTQRYGALGIGVSLPSLRADTFSVNLSAEIQKVRKTGLTFAPEAGTDRLRKVINKNITDEDIFGAAEAAWRQGWKRIKLYFMIGLPTETDEDLCGIARMVKGIKQHAWVDGRVKLDISVGLSSFVPKPHTPFQWRAQASLEELSHKVSVIRDALRVPGVKLSWNQPEGTLLEGALARGDRRMAQVIHKAWMNGARFDAWNEWFNWGCWEQAFNESDVSPIYYTSRKRSYDEVLPWDHIYSGVTKKYLRLEDKRADSETPSLDCRSDRCHACGVSLMLPDHAAHGTCYHD